MAAIYHIFSAARVARLLGVEEDLIHDVANTLAPEDGVISVYDLDDDVPILSFTDDGIDNLKSSLRELGHPFKDGRN